MKRLSFNMEKSLYAFPVLPQLKSNTYSLIPKRIEV